MSHAEHRPGVDTLSEAQIHRLVNEVFAVLRHSLDLAIHQGLEMALVFSLAGVTTGMALQDPSNQPSAPTNLNDAPGGVMRGDENQRKERS